MNILIPKYLEIIDDKSLILKLYIQPSSRGEEIFSGIHDCALKIRINAAAVDGKANEAVIKFIQKWLDLKKQQIILISGEKSRFKRIKITQLKPIILDKLLNP